MTRLAKSPKSESLLLCYPELKVVDVCRGYTEQPLRDMYSIRDLLEIMDGNFCSRLDQVPSRSDQCCT